MGRNRLVPGCTLGVCWRRLSVSVSSKTVGGADGDSLDVELACDYLFGVFISHTLHTAGDMVDVGMLFSFLFHSCGRFYRLNNVGSSGRCLTRVCIHTCTRWGVHTLVLGCWRFSLLAVFSRVSVRAHVCARQRDFSSTDLSGEEVSLVSVKRSVFFSLHRKKGEERGCQQKSANRGFVNLQQGEIYNSME